MVDEKKNRRTEIVVFASLATALIVGVIVVLLLPGRSVPPPVTNASASASSSTPKTAASPAWTPPSFEDEDALPPLPTQEAPIVVASNAPIVMSSGNIPTTDKGQPSDDVFPLEPKDLQDTATRYTPRLEVQCAVDKTTHVVLLVKLKPDGWVESTSVQTTDGAQPVADCVAEKVKRWHFKSSTSGGTASIPFTLNKK